MKKRSLHTLIGILTLTLLCIADPAVASQGVYGTVYAYTDPDYFGNPIITNDSGTVANALVRAYRDGTLITQATATICGYYSLDLSPGTYTIQVANGYYYVREVDSCSTVFEYDYLGGQRLKTVYSGWWYQLDLLTY